MRFLIVEDNEEKARQITEIVETFAPTVVFHVRGLRAAYPAIQTGAWDIVVLDMTLHAAEGTFSAGSKESLAGIEVLQAMQAGGDTAPVIVATQHDVFRQDPLFFESVEALDIALRDAFPDIYFCTVRVRLGSDLWKNEIKERIQQLIARGRR
ncbi:response regulator [Mesorhizobium sp.]|uniref:response regulator n=1 Tax=Mesorhizobium sp. TaxID=1871066 RepID=UPI0011F69BFF|nr:response regulator [Mesorhizobium sp.]TIQ79902.1 MAG: response regulator [Mesorhizobium sp.]